jgi:MSHA pilin protein MshD
MSEVPQDLSVMHPNRGFTLIEMIIAIVVIGVGLAGVLAAFTGNFRASADPMIRKQMLALAEGMMEEVTLKPFAVGAGARAGCNRTNTDDVRDYDNYSEAVCAPDGTPNPDLATYSVAIDVSDAPVTWNGANQTLKITVTVSHGSEAISLTGWRTNYATP